MKIWKMVNGTWYGYGNGHKAVIYETLAVDHVRVFVLKGENPVGNHTTNNIPNAKRWAEKNYLKGTK